MDNLSVLKDFQAPLQKFEYLLLQSRRAFLIGAGCSKCAGLPLTDELTKKCIDSDVLDTESKEILVAIKDGFEGASPPAHIEDYLSELVDLVALTDRRKYKRATNQSILLSEKTYSVDLLSKAVEQIKRAIAAEIKVQVKIDTHRRFSDIVHRESRPGKRSIIQVVDYIVLNYDTLIEDALALSCVPFADGMNGGVTGWWDPTVFDRKDLIARVYKLHGSINWYEFPGETLPRRISTEVNITGLAEKPILIWPASTKYREAQLDPYAHLAEKVRHLLNPGYSSQRVLVICGYSFGDSHINIEIEKGLRSSLGDLTLIAFTNEDQPSGKLKEWHEDNDITNQILIYANKGFFHGDDIQKSETDILWWKFENIVRILDGER